MKADETGSPASWDAKEMAKGREIRPAGSGVIRDRPSRSLQIIGDKSLAESYIDSLDPELGAMARFDRMARNLDKGELARVVRWINSKYGGSR